MATGETRPSASVCVSAAAESNKWVKFSTAELNSNDLLPDSQLVSSPEDMSVLGREGVAAGAAATRTLSCHLFVSPLTFSRLSAPTAGEAG